jgi:hypothetical protein
MGVFLREWPFIFCETEAATPSQEPQCAATGFGLRTCNAAMPQMRVSFAKVE